jgi:hypothetical protein
MNEDMNFITSTALFWRACDAIRETRIPQPNNEVQGPYFRPQVCGLACGMLWRAERLCFFFSSPVSPCSSSWSCLACWWRARTTLRVAETQRRRGVEQTENREEKKKEGKTEETPLRRGGRLLATGADQDKRATAFFSLFSLFLGRCVFLIVFGRCEPLLPSPF